MIPITRYIARMPITPLHRIIAVLSLLVVLIAGCDNSFNPKSEFVPRLVVYCVLDAGSSTQMVRLESTYDAELGSTDVPANKPVIDSAVVTIADVNGRRFTLIDTLISITDSNGVQKTQKVWITHDLRPVDGRNYHIEVTSPGFEKIYADMSYPIKPYLYISKETNDDGSGSIIMAASNPTGGSGPKGYYFRMYLRATRNVGTEKQVYQVEVPYTTDGSTAVFPGPSRSNTITFTRNLLIEYYQKYFISDPSLTDVKVFFKAYSLDLHIYNYFKTVRGFDDPVSVRQDKPDVTNITNGFGVFGGIQSDSTSRDYSYMITL
jgi:hypothetical protein